jgi:hypothetical protein
MIWGVVGTKVIVTIVALMALVVIIAGDSLAQQLPYSNPFSNPIYIGLIISGIIVITTWWIHTKLKTLENARYTK